MSRHQTTETSMPEMQSEWPSGIVGKSYLIVEGRRHNLVFHSNDIERWLPQRTWPAASGSGTSIFADETVAAFECRSNRSYEFRIDSANSLSRRDFTFSLYVVAYDFMHSIPYEIVITDGNERKIHRGSVTRYWSREYISFQFADRPEVISCIFKILPNALLKTPTRFKISATGICLEEGLFPSMPVVSYDDTGMRAQDFLSIDLRENDEGPLAAEGTIVFAYWPIWTADQLTQGIDPCVLEAVDDNGDTLLRLFHNSRDSAQLSLETFDPITGERSIFSGARPQPANRVFVVSLAWEGSNFWLNLDGDLVASGDADLRLQGAEKIYLGCRHDTEDHSLFANLSQFICFSEAFRGKQLRAALFGIDPKVFARFEEEYVETLGELEFDNVFNEEPYKTCAHHLLRVVSNWAGNLNPMGDEAKYRDDCARFLEYSNIINSSEAQNPTGKTDLLIHLPATHSGSQGDSNRRFRVEFKIWPRNDYDKIPDKPMKYMTAMEEAGAFIMISQHKRRDIRKEFFQLAITSETFPMVKFIEQPYGKSHPYHFIVEHLDTRSGSHKQILYLLASSLITLEDIEDLRK